MICKIENSKLIPLIYGYSLQLPESKEMPNILKLVRTVRLLINSTIDAQRFAAA